MKDHKPLKNRFQTTLTRVLLGFMALECLVIISLLITDEKQRMQIMKERIEAAINDTAGTQFIERYESWRVGPYTHVRLVFFQQQDSQISAEFHQWFGFTPQLSCVSIDPAQPCQ